MLLIYWPQKIGVTISTPKYTSEAPPMFGLASTLGGLTSPEVSTKFGLSLPEHLPRSLPLL